MIMVPAMHQPLAGTEFLPVTELLFDLGPRALFTRQEVL